MLRLRALEVAAVTHCNLMCVGCNHSSPVSEVSFADVAAVDRDFSGLAEVIEPTYVRVVGGEPLLHPRLDELIGALRSAMPTSILRVDTNGTRLGKVPTPWLADIDELQVSVYPGAAVLNTTLRELAAECANVGTALLVARFFAFRASRPIRPLGTAETLQVFETCQMAHANSCHVVQDGYVYLCPPSAPSAIGRHQDPSCPIEPRSTLEIRLSEFLNRDEPLTKCQDCLGTVGTPIPHTMASRKTWVELSSRGEIDYAHMSALRQDPHSDNFCSVGEVWSRGARDLA
ncbi:radical SAM protein [Saccharopolyspora sp. K220]|uniref:radical SAM protein n=1 Tax=Saccharopolyspora soli TaxID=2926618 RepID=UPI001F5826B6|nr:radical SAM protein [Saccharopolyspora soli]MCI2419583.1 radical SAM protein [Saccharopolyspora soli]